MAETESAIERLIRDLKQQRDELRLKIHLGGEDLKDELARLEERLEQLSQRYEPVKEAVEESAEDVWQSLKLVGNEISEGFRRIRKSL